MKVKNIAAFILIGIMAVSFTACSSGKSTAQDQAENSSETAGDVAAGMETTDNLSGTVVITGSTSVEPILNDMIDEFQALNPDVTINYTGTGSSSGISDTLAGSNTIGTSSREVKEEEKQGSLSETVFAYDGIAVIVNTANTIEDITNDDLAKIYSGEITNWKQLGGADKEIVVISREGASGTRSAFEELIKLEDKGGLVESASVVEGNGNVQLGVSGNENAIGYVSFSYINETVKALKVEGVEPTAENAKAGNYNLSRPFLFVYLNDTITPEGKAFLEYSVSEDGQNYVEEHGGIKVN